VTAKEQLDGMTGQINFIIGLASHGADPLTFSIEDFEQTNDAPEPWNGDYRFAFVIRAKNKRDAEAMRDKDQNGLTPEKFRQSLKQNFYWVEEIAVTDVKTADPKEVRYDVTFRGSNVPDARAWIYEPRILFAIPLSFLRTSLNDAVYWIEDKLVGGVGAWVGILIGVVITAFFVPSMLRKGTVDLLIVKPIPRPLILLYKYVGGLSFVFLNSLFVVVGMWLVLGLRSGIWAPGFLVSILTITFFFAILYSLSVLLGVLTGSPVVSILLTVVAWFALWLVGTVYTGLEGLRKNEGAQQASGVPGWVFTTVDVLHFVLPRTKDVDILSTKVISRGVLTEAEIKHRGLDKLPDLNWAESLSVSGAFMAVMLGLASWRFAVKDY
jgi:ABC-type transport system involved in multi-copper enzyme maturation permease subunit